MPIGKNAIKRVENNGYSKVNTSAPDMLNSTVIAGTSSEVIEMVESMVKAPEKEAEVKPVKKQTAKKTTVKKAVKPNNNIGKISFGEDLPYYLL